jgi:hypothetical protein
VVSLAPFVFFHTFVLTVRIDVGSEIVDALVAEQKHEVVILSRSVSQT